GEQCQQGEGGDAVGEAHRGRIPKPCRKSFNGSRLERWEGACVARVPPPRPSPAGGGGSASGGASAACKGAEAGERAQRARECKRARECGEGGGAGGRGSAAGKRVHAAR